MTLRLYADECVDARVVTGLQRRGIDIVTVADEGLLGATDERQLVHAIETGRVLLSRDQDFLRLVKERLASVGSAFPGLIFVLPGASVGEVVRGVDFVASTLDAEEMVDMIEWVP